jgi:tRNA pseudouridine38-40 synthase
VIVRDGENAGPGGSNTSRNIKLVVEYDGTDYSGFQVQPNVRTIQGELEAALLKLTGEGIRINAAGRTDAGVHAVGQVVNFKTGSSLDLNVILKALNALLPEDIAVRQGEIVAPEFHARFRARSREYQYTIVNRLAKPAVGRQYAHHFRRRLDVDDMQRACEALVGVQDFASFCAANENIESTVREVLEARCEREDEVVRITVKADAFLPHMVRNIVGTLLWVGSGKADVKVFREILAARDRTQAGPTAPPRGLCLTKVNY